MAKKVGARQGKTLECTVCKSENYRTEKNVKNTTDRLNISKYCPKCGKHTEHKEKK
jgi:large subunit ribosomal protein L33